MNPILLASILTAGVTVVLAVLIVGISMFYVYGGTYESELTVTPGDAADSSDQAESSPVSGENGLPYNSQRILVTTKQNTAVVKLLEYDGSEGKWDTVLTFNGYIGKNGATGEKVEGDKCTPKGTFDLCFVFGLKEPDTKLTFIKVNKNNVWVDDPFSDYYNTWQTSNAKNKDWKSAVKLYTVFDGNIANYRIAFAFNGDCMTKNSAEPGRGSAIFIEGIASKGKLEPGYGSISLSQSDMTKLLSRLDSSKHPQVQIK